MKKAELIIAEKDFSPGIEGIGVAIYNDDGSLLDRRTLILHDESSQSLANALKDLSDFILSCEH